jgi:hypothetical protein
MHTLQLIDNTKILWRGRLIISTGFEFIGADVPCSASRAGTAVKVGGKSSHREIGSFINGGASGYQVEVTGGRIHHNASGAGADDRVRPFNIP